MNPQHGPYPPAGAPWARAGLDRPRYSRESRVANLISAACLAPGQVTVAVTMRTPSVLISCDGPGNQEARRPRFSTATGAGVSRLGLNTCWPSTIVRLRIVYGWGSTSTLTVASKCLPPPSRALNEHCGAPSFADLLGGGDAWLGGSSASEPPGSGHGDNRGSPERAWSSAARERQQARAGC